jgi:hypothetical protein
MYQQNLVRVQVDINNPRPGSEAPDASSICCKPRQTVLKLPANRFKIIEYSMGEFFLSSLVPDMLLWV